MDPEIDYEYLADQTEGFSGADIAGVCKAAAKNAIRNCISAERAIWTRKEEKRREAEEKGMEYVSDDEGEEDPTPFITKEMLDKSLKNASRSVSKADLEKYMRYKRDMERRLGMDDDAPARVVGLDREERGGGAAAPAPAARDFGGEEAEDDDDIYS